MACLPAPSLQLTGLRLSEALLARPGTWHWDIAEWFRQPCLLLSVQGGLSPDELAETGKEASRLEATVVAVKALKEHLQVTQLPRWKLYCTLFPLPSAFQISAHTS